MARSYRLAFSSLALALAASAGALAAMPESEFNSLLEKYDERMTELRKARGSLDDAIAIQVEFSKQIPISELTLPQLREVSERGLITTYKRGGEHDRTDEALKVVDPLTKGTSIEAVEALAFKATLLVSEDEARQAQLVDTLEAALSHAALPAALRENRVPDLWYAIGYQTPKDGFVELSEELSSAASRFPADAHPSACNGMTTVYERATATDVPAIEQAAEDLRVKALGILEKAKEGDDDKLKRAAAREYSTLEAAPRIAKLVGNTAPELNFTWSSGGESLQALSDLRGKVVVLDFWATWCGPCVASFPQVRELAAHYEGYPVEIVGVTSLQGKTFFEAGPEDTPTAEAEHEAMHRYMKERDITWTVAFSEQEVFNPEYGVRGIPHVVIIDPDGKIVHRALHPASPLAKKTDLIDPILREFGFDTPPAPAAAPAPAPAGGE